MQVFHSGIPLTLVPLDATNTIPVTEKFFREFEKSQKTFEAQYCFKSLKMSRDTWFDDQFYTVPNPLPYNSQTQILLHLRFEMSWVGYELIYVYVHMSSGVEKKKKKKKKLNLDSAELFHVGFIYIWCSSLDYAQ